MTRLFVPIPMLLASLAALPLQAGDQPTNAGRGAGTVPIWNPHRPAPGNPPLTVRVLVLNYDPIVPAEGHRRLSQVFGWNDPARLATECKEAMEFATGGYVRFEIVEWRNHDEIYAHEDGHRETVENYVRNRRTNSGWGEHGSADYPRLLHEQNVEPLVDDGLVDEVWVFSDHFFGLWEASMAGPGAFNINGGVYPQVPVRRPFAIYGFNYERGVAEMMHDASHRTEATLNRVYGGWDLKAPKTLWDRFSANVAESNGSAGVGTCHFPANGASGYDYGNPRVVASWADAYLTFPKVDFRTKSVSRATWSRGPDYHLDYMKWYFAHLPRAAGVNPDGRQNNWLKYIFDFDGYDAVGRPVPAVAKLLPGDVADPRSKVHTIRVVYRSAEQVDPKTLDAKDLAVTGPGGEVLSVRLVAGAEAGNRSDRVVSYEVAAPAKGWAAGGGAYDVALRAGEVRDLAGTPLPAVRQGSFRVVGTEDPPVESQPGEKALLSVPFENGAQPTRGPRPTEVKGLRDGEGISGRGAVFARDSGLAFPTQGAIDPRAGTLEVWVRPNWGGPQKATHVLAAAGRPFDNGLLLSVDGASNLVFITWGDDPSTSAVESGAERGLGTPAASWKAGRWYHLAATWGGPDGSLALYVDGRRVAEGPGSKISRFGEPTLRIGSTGNDSADATLDGLVILGRPLTREEVLSDYESALPAGPLTVRGPSGPLLPGAWAVVRALSRSPVGVERERTREVAWSSDAPDVATVDPRGTVRARKAGRATISARRGQETASAAVEVRDPGLPTARLVRAGGVTAPGPKQVDILISYSDPGGIVRDSIGQGDVRVVGPNGFQQFPGLASIDDRASGVVSAIYRVAPASGRWGPNDRGVYTIEVKGFQVADRKGNHVPEQVIGQFRVLGGGADR